MDEELCTSGPKAQLACIGMQKGVLLPYTDMHSESHSTLYMNGQLREQQVLHFTYAGMMLMSS